MSFDAYSQIVKVLDAWWKRNVSFAFRQVQLAVMLKTVMTHAPGDGTRRRYAPDCKTKTPNPFIFSPSDCLDSTRCA